MSLKVLRAHDYRAVEAVRRELARLPDAWLAVVAHVPWLILPDGLSPLFIGLLAREVTTHYGGPYSECGGWACRASDLNIATVPPPHIYLSDACPDSAVHEAAHHLEVLWHAPIDDLYRPDAEFYPYMVSNPTEYFACALDAFLTPGRDGGRWNRDHLARRDIDMWRYLSAKEA